MTEFTLVRHGQTDWNVARRYQGQLDIPLNTEGIRQAEVLAELLAAETFDAIYSSDLQRAMQTAVILQRGRKIAVIPDSRLREIGFGEWEGECLKDVMDAYPQRFSQSAEDPTVQLAPGGESVSAVAARTIAFANEISGIFPKGNILVVTHGLALATLICRVEAMPLTEAYRVVPDNAQPQQIHWSPPEAPI